MKSPWHKMKTEPPEVGISYIVKCNATGRSKGVLEMTYVERTIRGEVIKRWEWQGRIAPWVVTHWMPMPEPPEEE